MNSRPQPSIDDLAEAEAFVRETYDENPEICRTWLAAHRSDLVAQAAMLAMGRRVNAKPIAAPRRRLAA